MSVLCCRDEFSTYLTVGINIERIRRDAKKSVFCQLPSPAFFSSYEFQICNRCMRMPSPHPATLPSARSLSAERSTGFFKTGGRDRLKAIAFIVPADPKQIQLIDIPETTVFDCPTISGGFRLGSRYCVNVGKTSLRSRALATARSSTVGRLDGAAGYRLIRRRNAADRIRWYTAPTPR
jgi:hypothetical protein